MSIIQHLRDKSAVLLTGFIALSLIGFLVQDAFIGKSGGASSSTTSVGSINGVKIDVQDYNQKVRMMEESNRQQGSPINEQMTQNIMESVWNGYIQETLLQAETNKLGISFTAKEMGDLLFSDYAPQEFKQLFTDQTTGQYNIDQARNWFNNIKKSKKPEDVKLINDQLIQPLINRQLSEKYNSIFAQGTYVPKWLIQKLNQDNSSFSSIAYIQVPYALVADSTVAVSDADINAYTAAHKEEFKQAASKSIAYVSFDANPSSKDSATLYNQLTNAKADFYTTSDNKAFVVRNNSGIPFFDGYVLKSRLAQDAKDSLVALGNNQVYGPYVDGGSYVVAKKLETKLLPDSIKMRHILIGLVDRKTGQPLRTDSAAKKSADSVFTAIKGGANFSLLAAVLSDDEGSKLKGGEYNFSSVDMGTLAKEFADYIFYNKAGDRAVVKTDFGYHIIEILTQKNFEEGYKIAYLSKKIVSSQETDDLSSTIATQFAGTSRDAKSFDAQVTKLNLAKRTAENIKPMDYAVANMPSRAFVKWIYENKVGAVSEPFDFKDKYVVAIITGSFEEGVQSAAIARVMVEPIVRNQKKAAQLMSKVGTAANLQAVAGMFKQPINSIDTLRFSEQFIPNLGPETKVIGAALNKKNLNKVSSAIEGQSGLFFIETRQIGALPSFNNSIEEQQKSMSQQMRQYAMYGSFEALKKAATIKDNRREAGF
jgi:peptidyl-prolyl cis-trans isomerase D